MMAVVCFPALAIAMLGRKRQVVDQYLAMCLLTISTVFSENARVEGAGTKVHQQLMFVRLRVAVALHMRQRALRPKRKAPRHNSSTLESSSTFRRKPLPVEVTLPTLATTVGIKRYDTEL